MKKLATILVAALLATGCSAGSPGGSPASSTSTPMSSWEQAEPGEHNVSTMEPGKEFEAEPNFFYYKGCGHPCNPGVYPSANPADGTPSITDRFPLEASEGRAADRVLVVCQVIDGKPAANDTGATSRVWNKLRIPAEHLAADAPADLEQDSAGNRYGWAPDIWLGNTGPHDLPCS